MDDFPSSEETAFVVGEVTDIIQESIEGVIGDNEYQHSKVNQWTSDVVEQCINQLNKLENPLRYSGSCTVRWSNETVYCIVSVFGLAI